ncbi:MAG: hypothetical protein ABH805_02555 [Candidatus Nealsonbacteria bacterium]
MVKLLGILDLVAALSMVGLAYNLPLARGMIIFLAVYLLLKAILFLTDIGSLFDIIGGVLLVLSLFMVLPQLLFFVIAALIGLKGLMSLAA